MLTLGCRITEFWDIMLCAIILIRVEESHTNLFDKDKNTKSPLSDFFKLLEVSKILRFNSLHQNINHSLRVASYRFYFTKWRFGKIRVSLALHGTFLSLNHDSISVIHSGFHSKFWNLRSELKTHTPLILVWT